MLGASKYSGSLATILAYVAGFLPDIMTAKSPPLPRMIADQCGSGLNLKPVGECHGAKPRVSNAEERGVFTMCFFLARFESVLIRVNPL